MYYVFTNDILDSNTQNLSFAGRKVCTPAKRGFSYCLGLYGSLSLTFSSTHPEIRSFHSSHTFCITYCTSARMAVACGSTVHRPLRLGKEWLWSVGSASHPLGKVVGNDVK